MSLNGVVFAASTKPNSPEAKALLNRSGYIVGPFDTKYLGVDAVRRSVEISDTRKW
jgi:hypothetical protein